MAVQSRADATWQGDLQSGKGTVKPASGSFGEQTVTWQQRSADRSKGTSPEELLAAAHAACFSMALANALTQAGHAPERLDATAAVDFQGGQGITGITLSVRGKVPGMDDQAFRSAAENAKANCPVSKALTGVPIKLEVGELAAV